MGAQGTATIDFGAFPGSNEATVTVTGQGTIASDSAAEAWIMAEATSDHTAKDHTFAALLIALTCGTVVPGTGFTINATSPEKLQGTFALRWVWN